MRPTLPTAAIWVFILPLALSLLCGVAQAEARVALVIGNGKYLNAPALTIPPNDSKLMAQSLRRIGVDVTEKQDVGIAEMQAAILDFGRAARGADVALIYYSGHGIQLRGRNYLIPIDARFENETALQFQTVSLEALSDAIAGAHTRIVIIDACRDNPFAAHMTLSRPGRGLARGLARLDNVALGELIEFSMEPGRTAEDGPASNSIFAAALATYLQQPGLEIEQAFKRARLTVYKVTGAAQIPWEISATSADVYLNGASATATLNQSGEMLMWESAQNAGTVEAYQAYKRKYPNSEFARLADIALALLAHPQSTSPATR